MMSHGYCGIVLFLTMVSACGGSSTSSDTGATGNGGSASGADAGVGGAGLGGAAGTGLDAGGAGSAGIGGTGGAGIGGTGGAAGSPGYGGSAGSTGCPGTGGSTMVKVPAGYCIDSTEVTVDQYLAWLASNPSTSGQPSYCSWNTTFVPKDESYLGGDRPITWVDWCDAQAYCKAVGKRLCGKTGGGPTDWDDVANAAVSQWYNACSSGGKHTYPYGGVYHPNGCNGIDNIATATAPAAAAALSDCVSAETGYAGIYDLSGNVVEWEDSCDGDTGANDYCRTRGGSYKSGQSELTCSIDTFESRDRQHPTVGFRCCSDP